MNDLHEVTLRLELIARRGVWATVVWAVLLLYATIAWCGRTARGVDVEPRAQVRSP